MGREGDLDACGWKLLAQERSWVAISTEKGGEGERDGWMERKTEMEVKMERKIEMSDGNGDGDRERERKSEQASTPKCMCAKVCVGGCVYKEVVVTNHLLFPSALHT